jgi:hypothetical protein
MILKVVQLIWNIKQALSRSIAQLGKPIYKLPSRLLEF